MTNAATKPDDFQTFMAAVMEEIHNDPQLTERQKLAAVAKAAREFRQITGQTESVREVRHRNKSSIGGTFARSAARTLGRHLVKGIFK